MNYDFNKAMYQPCFCTTPAIFKLLESIEGFVSQRSDKEPGHKPLSSATLQRLHAQMGGSGAFRSVPPCPHWVPVLIQALLEWLNNSPTHLLIRAAVFHYELLLIHPFDAANEALATRLHQQLLTQWHPRLVNTDLPEVQPDDNATTYIERCLNSLHKQLSEELVQTVNQPERQILHHLQEHPGCKRQDLLTALPRFSARVLDRHLQHLRESGAIEYRGSRKTGAYYPRQTSHSQTLFKTPLPTDFP